MAEESSVGWSIKQVWAFKDKTCLYQLYLHYRNLKNKQTQKDYSEWDSQVF